MRDTREAAALLGMDSTVTTFTPIHPSRHREIRLFTRKKMCVADATINNY